MASTFSIPVLRMTPGSFDPVTAREIVSDEHARAIETKARLDADACTFDPPPVDGATYWDAVSKQMRQVIYTCQYQKRVARMQRKQSAAS